MKTEPLRLNHIYTIELCSGEKRLWKYLGLGDGESSWWQDMESEVIFNESSILYAWKIL